MSCLSFAMSEPVMLWGRVMLVLKGFTSILYVGFVVPSISINALYTKINAPYIRIDLSNKSYLYTKSALCTVHIALSL